MPLNNGLIVGIVEKINSKYKFFLNIKINTFIKINEYINRRSPIFILIKTKQFFEKGKINCDSKQDLPIGRFYHLYCNGLEVGYLFEIPNKKDIQIHSNFFSIQLKPETQYYNVKCSFKNNNINVFNANSSMLVTTNYMFLDIKH